jgi:hypothetical protein
MSYQQHGFSETDLSRFREVQRLAYQCTVEISHHLTEGVTEIEACARMESWLRKRGVQDFFQSPSPGLTRVRLLKASGTNFNPFSLKQ